MTETSPTQEEIPICVALPEGGQALVPVPLEAYRRYDGLRQQGILSDEKLGRLATDAGLSVLTTQGVLAVLEMPDDMIQAMLVLCPEVPSGG